MTEPIEELLEQLRERQIEGSYVMPAGPKIEWLELRTHERTRLLSHIKRQVAEIAALERLADEAGKMITFLAGVEEFWDCGDPERERFSANYRGVVHELAAWERLRSERES